MYVGAYFGAFGGENFTRTVLVDGGEQHAFRHFVREFMRGEVDEHDDLPADEFVGV